MRNAQFVMLQDGDDVTRTGNSFFAGQWIAGSFVPTFGDNAAAGTVKIQVSNDLPVGAPQSYTPSAASWADIPNATSAITAGVGPAIVIGNMAFGYIRAVFTQSSPGNTTVTVRANVLSA